MHDVTDWLRVYVIVVSIVVAIAGSLQWRRWPGFKVENRLAWLSLVALNFAMGYGTWETLRAGVPGGPRNYVTCLAMTFLLAAVFYHPVVALRARLSRRKENRP